MCACYLFEQGDAPIFFAKKRGIVIVKYEGFQKWTDLDRWKEFQRLPLGFHLSYIQKGNSMMYLKS